MKKLTIFVLVAVLAIAGASAAESNSNATAGTQHLSVGLGYGYDLYSLTGIHGLSIDIYAQSRFPNTDIALYADMDITFPMQMISAGSSIGRKYFDKFFGMGMAFGAGKEYQLTDGIILFAGGGMYWKWFSAEAGTESAMDNILGVEGNVNCTFLVTDSFVVDVGARIGTPLLISTVSYPEDIYMGGSGLSILARVAAGYRF